jgi:tryptophan halogenase
VHYKFNNRLNTPFWRHCWNDTDLAGAREIVDLYQESGPVSWLRQALPAESGFGPAGYVVLLTGQKVDYRLRRQPTEHLMRVWNAERQRVKNIAEKGLTIREALARIRGQAPAYR